MHSRRSSMNEEFRKFKNLNEWNRIGSCSSGKKFFDRSYTGTKDSGLASPPSSDAPRSSRRQIQLQMQRSTTCVGRSENLDRTLENLYLLYRGRLLRAGDAARLLDRIETLLPYLLGDRPNHYLELVRIRTWKIMGN